MENKTQKMILGKSPDLHVINVQSNLLKIYQIVKWI